MPQAQLQDFKMHYVEHGSGSEPIVFVHGFISTQVWWQPTLERLPDNFHAYAVDLRACGDSEQVETGLTLAQMAEDLHQFVEQIGTPVGGEDHLAGEIGLAFGQCGG